MRLRLFALSLAALACGGEGPTEQKPDPTKNIYGILVGVHAPVPEYVFPGMTLNLWAQANDSAHVVLDVPASAYTWKSLTPAVAEVDQQGHVVVKAPGQLSIVVTAGTRGGGIGLNVVLPSQVYALEPDTSLLLPGQQRLLKLVTGLSYNPVSTAVNGAWATSDASVVRVDSSGLLTAVAPGRATVSLPQVSGVAFTLRAEVTVQSLPLPLRFQEVVKGNAFTCGRTATDTYCWGAKPFLGTTAALERCTILQYFLSSHPSYITRSTSSCAMEPVRVEAAVPFTALSVERSTACGLASDGRAYCWGDTRAITGDTAFSQRPVLASETLRFRQFDYPCGVTLAGEAWCWGDKRLRGTVDTLSTPSRVDGGATWQSVTGGANESYLGYSGVRCGITTARAIRCWGTNSAGQLGTGDTTSFLTPRAIQSTASFNRVVVGGSYACALADAGELWCWGRGGSAQTSPDQWLPSQRNPGVQFATLEGYVSASACAVTTAGAPYCAPFDGASLNPISADRPFQTFMSAGAVRCGLALDGIAYCWGGGTPLSNADIGAGDQQYRPAPTRVLGQ
jgi:hypothetical protein